MGLELAKAWIRVRADTSRVKGDITKSKPGIMAAVGGMARSMAPMLAAGGVGMGLMKLAKSGEEFNQKMRGSLAIMGDVSQAMRKDMVDAAMEVAKTTKYSASQAAESYYFLASAGLDAQQSVAALSQVSLFAQAGMFDMARATDLATDAQSALGLTVKDAQGNLTNLTRVTDVLVKANTLANASVEQFSMALTTKAGAAAKIVGKDIEETVSMLAAFADQGMKGAMAGTAVNIVLRDMQSRALEAKKSGGELYRMVYKESGEMQNLADIIQSLEERMKGLSAEEQKATMLRMGFTDKSMIFIQTLMGTSEKMRKYEKELRKAGGTTKEVADKQLTPFQKSWAKLSVEFVKVGRLIMRSVVPAFQQITKVLTSPELKAAFKLLGELSRSVADTFMAVWEVALNYLSTSMSPFVENFREAFKTIIGFADSMLGSWEGLREGLHSITYQTVLMLKANWISYWSWWKLKSEEMVGSLIDVQHQLGQIGMEAFMPAMSKMMIGWQRGWAKLTGQEFIVTPEQEAELIKSVQSEAMDELTRKRKENEKETMRGIKAVTQEYRKQIAAIGKLSLEESERIEKIFGKLPTLSGRFKDELEKILGIAKIPGAPGLPTLPGGAEGAGAGGRGGGTAYDVARLGFREYGKQIQDALMKKDKQAEVVDVLKKNLTQAELTNDVLQKIEAKEGGFTLT